MITASATARPALRLLAVASALSLTLAACSGGAADGTTDDANGDQSASEQLPADGDGSAPVTSEMCVEDEPDCDDTMAGQGIDEGEPGTVQDGGASSSCLVGDASCVDESFEGGDVTRPIPLTDGPLQGDTIAEGSSSGATGQLIEAAAIDGTSLSLSWSGGACDVLEDVLLSESDTEVRILVLAGMAADVDACTQQVVQWQITVTLTAELGDRPVLDLAG